MATDWQPECIIPQSQPALESVGAHSERALQNTYGNVQSYSEDFAHSDPMGRNGCLQQYALRYPPHLPPAAPTHPVSSVSASLHTSQQLASRAQARKERRLNSANQFPHGPRRRSYLKSQKYLEYRRRPRRDTGKDGEPVWSDELEDAFQQGKHIQTHQRQESQC